MIKKAIIESTMLGREDCGISGHCLDQYVLKSDSRVYSAKSTEVFSNILDVVGVKNWEDLWLDFEEFFSVVKN